MQRYIIVDKYRDGEMSWEMKPHDHGDIAFYADALADIEAAVHEWQDIAGQWEDKCQKLTEQIAALTAELKSLTEAYNNTDWKKINDDQKDTINTLTVKWGKLLIENKRLEKALNYIAEYWNGHENPMATLDAANMARDIARDALNGKEELKVAPYSYENLKGIDES